MQLAFDFDPAPRREPPARPAAPPARRPGAPPVGRARLLARIRRALDVPAELVVTDNRRVMISTRRRDGRLEVRLHHMFLDAPEEVVEELLCYLAEGDARASRRLGRYIESNRHRIGPRRRRVTLRPRGEHHDLEEILGEVVRDHFPEGVEGVWITWGRRLPRRARRRSIRLGTYTREQGLVRIHRALDRASVPRFFVSFVVFHELLHHVVPAREVGRRLDHHPPEFRRRERAHPDYERALRWEAEHLDALLGSTR